MAVVFASQAGVGVSGLAGGRGDVDDAVGGDHEAVGDQEGHGGDDGLGPGGVQEVHVERLKKMNIRNSVENKHVSR